MMEFIVDIGVFDIFFKLGDGFLRFAACLVFFINNLKQLFPLELFFYPVDF